MHPFKPHQCHQMYFKKLTSIQVWNLRGTKSESKIFYCDGPSKGKHIQQLFIGNFYFKSISVVPSQWSGNPRITHKTDSGSARFLRTFNKKVNLTSASFIDSRSSKSKQQYCVAPMCIVLVGSVSAFLWPCHKLVQIRLGAKNISVVIQILWERSR